MPNTLLSTKDVATRLQLSESYVQKAALRGELVGHRFGTSWRFTEDDVQAFIDAARHEPKRTAIRHGRPVKKVDSSKLPMLQQLLASKGVSI